jgi:uncharacterized protein
MTPRQPFPDLTRALALVGIAVVNVFLFAQPLFSSFFGTGRGSPADHAAAFIVMALFMAKSYTLFAYMFGAGVAQQMHAATAQGGGFRGRHLRRMLGLLALGVLNVWLLFYVDILFVYGLLGLLLLLFLGLGAPALRRLAILMYVLQIVVWLLLVLVAWALEVMAPDEAKKLLAEMAQDATRRTAGFSAADFATVAAMRFEAWMVDTPAMLLQQSLGVLAFMLSGLHAARTGLLDDPDAPLWSRSRRIYLPLGLLLSALGAWLMLQGDSDLALTFMSGFALVMIGSPLSTLGYLGWISAWARGSGSPLRDFLVRAGGGSLTAYLLQGLIMSLVFTGYGLGLYGKLGAAAAVLIGLGAGIASLLFVGWWRGRHALGPVEMLLRRWVYLGERRG